MDAQVALREIAATTSHLIDLPQSARNRLDASTDAVAIGFCPDQLNADPMVRHRAFRHQQGRPLVQLTDGNGQAATVVKIRSSRAPAGMQRRQAGARDRRDIFEAPVSQVPIQQFALAIR